MRFPRIIAAPMISLVLLTLPCPTPAQNQAGASEADSAADDDVFHHAGIVDAEAGERDDRERRSAGRD